MPLLKKGQRVRCIDNKGYTTMFSKAGEYDVAEDQNAGSEYVGVKRADGTVERLFARRFEVIQPPAQSSTETLSTRYAVLVRENGKPRASLGVALTSEADAYDTIRQHAHQYAGCEFEVEENKTIRIVTLKRRVRAQATVELIDA